MKRGTELTLNTFIILVLAVLVAAVLIIFFSGTAKSIFSGVGGMASNATAGGGKVASDAGNLIEKLRPEGGGSAPT